MLGTTPNYTANQGEQKAQPCTPDELLATARWLIDEGQTPVPWRVDPPPPGGDWYKGPPENFKWKEYFANPPRTQEELFVNYAAWWESKRANAIGLIPRGDLVKLDLEGDSGELVGLTKEWAAAEGWQSNGSPRGGVHLPLVVPGLRGKWVVEACLRTSEEGFTGIPRKVADVFGPPEPDSTPYAVTWVSPYHRALNGKKGKIHKATDLAAFLRDLWPGYEVKVVQPGSGAAVAGNDGGPIPEHHRNDTLISLAGTMRNRGMTQGEIEAALMVVNERCKPELPVEKVKEIAKTAGKWKAGSTDEQEHRTDLGNAKRMVAAHGADLRYVHPWRAWLAWDGTRWRTDDTAEVMRRAKDTVRGIYAEAAAGDEEARKATARWAMASETRARVEAMIALAASEPQMPVLPEELDADRWALNVLNGTLDLRTGELCPHDRADMITKLAPVEYEPAAECPQWIDFLQRIMAGNEELITFLQRAVGYCLTGDVSEQVLFLPYGKGANGKSTFLEVLLGLLGDYGRPAAPGLLLSSGQDRHPTEVADLFGARFVASVEVGEGRRMAEERVKQLTGGDRVKARRMREDFWTFEPTQKLWLSFNHKPIIRGTDLAIWRRIRLIPFTVTIPPEEQDRRLVAKLKAEGAGILRWAVEGCLAWQREGLGAPQDVAVATQEYRGEMDVLADFIAERCVEGEDAEATASELYSAYAEWAKGTGERFPMSKILFGEHLRQRGYMDSKRGKSRIRTWRGVRLIAPDDNVEGGGGAEELPAVEDLP